MTEFDDAKKLPPEERIRKLKELEQARKREIEEAEALIRDSMREINETAEKVPLRQVTAADISQLTTEEEKRVFKTARFMDSKAVQPEHAGEKAPGQHSLEEMAEEEAKKSGQEQQRKPVYGQALEIGRAPCRERV